MKKTAVALILVLVCLLGACGKEKSDLNSTEGFSTENVYTYSNESFTFANYNYTINSNLDNFTSKTDVSKQTLKIIPHKPLLFDNFTGTDIV